QPTDYCVYQTVPHSHRTQFSVPVELSAPHAQPEPSMQPRASQHPTRYCIAQKRIEFCDPKFSSRLPHSHLILPNRERQCVGDRGKANPPSQPPCKLLPSFHENPVWVCRA